MRARVHEARAANDAEAIGSACAALARWLASRDRDLDEAVELASEALRLKPDVELRRELSAWLTSLGEPARAASVLKPLAALPDIESTEAGQVLVRIGILRARGGATAAAAASFEAAASVDASDPLPSELLATLSAWQPDIVEPAAAVEAYLEAARRQAALDQREAELLDLWRAFAADPSNGAGVLALSGALEQRGRASAADEILRAHARALSSVDPAAAAAMHATRRAASLNQNEPVRALGAAFDEGLVAQFEGESSDQLDALLLGLGMPDAVAARLELAAEQASNPRRRASQLVQLAKLCSGPLADDERAALACLGAVAADPSSAAAREALGVQLERLRSRASASWSSPANALTPGEIENRLDSILVELSGIEDEGERRARLLERFPLLVPFLGDSATLERVEHEARDSPASGVVRESIAGAAPSRASAFERFAATQSAPVRAMLLAVAADQHMAGGNAAAARSDAELATRTDPTSARCLAAVADAVTAQPPDRRTGAALERAIGVIGPRLEWCTTLADALEARGEPELAAGWSQRRVSLRPGDHEAIPVLLDRLTRARDASRLRDARGWLSTQPQPALWVAEPFSRALVDLAGLDPDRASVVARRALDVFGPRARALRDAMLAVAERASDDAFAVAILERWLSCRAPGLDRPAVLLRLADLRLRLGDDEGAARVTARAVSEGMSGPDVDGVFDALSDRSVAPDGEVWRLRARAERLSKRGDSGASRAWREFGAALWDMADDRVGAVDAWQRGALFAPDGAHVMALDMVAFGGASFAFEYFRRAADGEADDAAAAALATAASGAALSVGEPSYAFDLAARAVARRPSSADALDAAEKAAEAAGERGSLSALYDLVATRAMGRFGRRAAHYRGARFFERRGDHALALKHAAQAFYAVPSEGSTFQFLARTAAHAGDRPLAVRTVEQVAERESRPLVRAGWLLRAASIAGDGEEGVKRKVDVLLRAVVAAPSVTTISTLRTTARDLLRFGPEERDGLELRLSHAVHTFGAQLDGPEGARISIAVAVTWLELFADSDSAMMAIERAFTCDADIEDYAVLDRLAPALAKAPNARTRVAALLDVADGPHANVGVVALRLLAAVSSALGDGALRGRASVAAAIRSPEDDALVVDADAGARGSPELAAQLSSRVPPSRRAGALVVAARSRIGEGRIEEATSLFERAAELLEGSARAEVEREIRAALDAAGRGGEIESRAYRDASAEDGPPQARADAWVQIAELREARRDHAGAVRALLESCGLDPAPLERWSSLERVAEIAGDDDARIVALENIELRVGAEGRGTVLKRLARAQERRGSLDAAERTWRRVLAVDSDDEEADQAVQSVIVARGDYDELTKHLAQRANRLHDVPEKREVLRAVRLRRAAILEQRLGRTRDACDELELLLREWPDSVGALRYLADLYDRQSDYARSAPLWRRAAAIEDNPNDSDELELRAARASHAAGDAAATHQHARRVLERRPESDEALVLRVEAARVLGADSDLGDALDAMARRQALDSGARTDLLIQAARSAIRAGDLDRALDRAQHAAEVMPDRAAPQLLARALEYRARGAGAPDEARQTIEELSRIAEPLGADDAAVRAFLLAEALDVVQGGGAGLRELEATRAIIGNHALVALAIAERIAAQGQYAAASDAYRVAILGPLLELRRIGPVAVAAAEAAMRAGKTVDVAYFLDVADGYEDVRLSAAALRAKMGALAVSAEPSGDVRLYDLEAAVHRAGTPAERARARLALARGRLDFGDARGAEPLLFESLADGLVDAGDVLAPLLASSRDRTPELVRVRWQQVALEPGDVERLLSLRAAALANDDRIHARAVEHVLRAFDPAAGPLPPPPLASQPDQPGILALLARPSMDAVGEALALLWDGAMQLFVRDAASYGITGLERILPGPSTAIARVYEAAIRVLDIQRTPLFGTRSSGPLEAHVALLSPPSVILTGDARQESAELRFALGAGLASALPHNVLRRALSKLEGRAVVDAMRTAFGPPGLERQVDARVARLAESFWQIIPASAQRRLQELLRSANVADYGELVEASLQSGRRVGMFLSGDFACAARSLLAESGSGNVREPTLGNLRELCSGMPALADLLRLAVRPEYADARWHSVASASQRRTGSSGRFSLF